MKKWILPLPLLTALISPGVFAEVIDLDTGGLVLAPIFDNSSGNSACSRLVGQSSTKNDLWLWRDGYFAARNQTLGLNVQADRTWNLRLELFCIENPEATLREAVSELYDFYMEKKKENNK